MNTTTVDEMQACACWVCRSAVAKQLEYAAKHPNGAPKFSSTTFRDDGVPIMLNPDGTRSIFCDIDQ